MLTSVFRTLKLTMRLFYPRLSRSQEDKYDKFAFLEKLASVLSIVQLIVFLQIICCRLAEETTTKKIFLGKTD